jgi:hypothetical protein
MPLARVPRDVWIGLVVLVAAVTYWRYADAIPISPLDGVVNAAAMPKVLAWGLGGLAVLLILRAVSVEVMAAQAVRAAGPRSRGAASEDVPASLRDHLKALGMAGFALCYVLLLPYLGYALSVALVVGCVSLYIGAPRDWKIPAVAVGAAVVFYLIFVVLLGIPQPPGLWPALLR